MAKEHGVPVNFRCPRAHLDELRRMADETGAPISLVMRWAVAAYLEQEGRLPAASRKVKSSPSHR